MDIRIGTAGYSYPAWVGPLDPAGTTGHDMLPFDARHFPAVGPRAARGCLIVAEV
jgi:uncharacterized protein YecE (DUF72 family)